MGRILARGSWLVAVLLCLGLIAWHLLAPAQRVASAPEPSPLPLASASAWGDASEAPLPDAAALSTAVSAALAGKHGKYAVSVQDVATGESLVDLDGATPGVPASSLKLLTGAAALASFDRDHRFPTLATLGTDGTLRLVGGGDALLGAGASDTAAVQGHAGLKTLAKEAVAALSESGIRSSYSVGVDTSLFPAPALNPDWTEDLITTNNITEIQTPVLNAGRAAASHSSAVVRRPAEAALTSFVEALNAAAKAAGIKASFTGVGQVAALKGATTLATVESATLLEQLHYMEKHSDNFMAETFGRLVAIQRGAAGGYQEATEQVSAAVKELGVNVDGLVMRDTSGLAATNRVSPATLAGLLAHAETSPRADLRELAGLLPVSGSTGTLAGRLGATDTKGLVRAKTGTLAAVVSLSGYATTKDGRLLSFSVMASGVQGAIAEARAAVDTVAATLVACGCR